MWWVIKYDRQRNPHCPLKLVQFHLHQSMVLQTCSKACLQHSTSRHRELHQPSCVVLDAALWEDVLVESPEGLGMGADREERGDKCFGARGRVGKGVPRDGVETWQLCRIQAPFSGQEQPVCSDLCH